MSTRSAVKRKRIESTEENSVPIVRSKVWYDDGNVVLEAQGAHFKVHRGLLSESSSVFRDMFTIPQPPSSPTEEIVDGCPVIHLSDSRLYLEYVLEALFQRKHVLGGAPMPLAIIAAFLRLGAKYDIGVLRTEALKRIYYQFPTNLAARLSMINWSTIEDTRSHTLFVHIVKVARENGLSSVLPLALYGCCRKQNLTKLTKDCKENKVVRLSSEDLQTYTLAYSNLAALQATTTYAWVYPKASATYLLCDSFEDCSSARNDFLISTFLPFPTIRGLQGWDSKWGENMCDECACIAKTSHNAGRQKFWDGIPAAFGLPGWAELEKERNMSCVPNLFDSDEALHDHL